VNAQTREIERHTSTEQIYAAADKLRKRHHAAIKTAFLRTTAFSFRRSGCASCASGAPGSQSLLPA
jgi:propanediol dehydratase small subunit